MTKHFPLFRLWPLKVAFLLPVFVSAEPNLAAKCRTFLEVSRPPIGQPPAHFTINKDLKSKDFHFDPKIAVIAEQPTVIVGVKRMIERQNSDVDIETFDSAGKPWYFRTSAMGQEAWAYKIEYKESAFYGLPTPHLAKDFDAKFKGFSISKLSKRQREALAQNINAVNVGETFAEPSPRVKKNLRAAADFIIQLADRSKDLSLEEILELNGFITHGLGQEEFESTIQRFSYLTENDVDWINSVSGVMRGTSVIRFWKRKKWIVDLRESTSLLGPFAEYQPAKAVPGLMKKWLKGLNAVNNNTPLKEIAKLYRDFILIHPFLFGNGRTARYLTIYALMKAGYRPPPDGHRLPHDVVFTTIDDLTLALARALEFPAEEALELNFGLMLDNGTIEEWMRHPLSSDRD
jgi:hypothetical protein